jgi:hypothetical protein
VRFPGGEVPAVGLSLDTNAIGIDEAQPNEVVAPGENVVEVARGEVAFIGPRERHTASRAAAIIRRQHKNPRAASLEAASGSSRPISSERVVF